MSDKYSCIYLGVILSVNYIISLILRNFRMKQYRSIIKFRHFGFFPMVVYRLSLRFQIAPDNI